MLSGSTAGHLKRTSRRAREGSGRRGFGWCRCVLAPVRPGLTMACLLGAAIGMLAPLLTAQARPGPAPVSGVGQTPRADETPPLPSRARRSDVQSFQAAQTATPPFGSQAEQPANLDASASGEKSQTQPDARTGHVPLPPRPTTALAEHVRTVLEKHCARCHQTGALQDRLSPEGGIANILALDAIAQNPSLVRPGEPDASPLYQQMIARQMPSDVLRHGTPGEAPDAAEVRVIRTWIRSLNGRAINGACPQRTPITPETLAATVSRWLDAIGAERAADTRFISLAHIYDACAGDAELAALRLGVVSVLNSLTWAKKPVAVETVGETLAILAVRLSDLGWTGNHWEMLAQRVAPAARIDLPEAARQQTGTTIPMLAGDWLAHEAMQPELYNRLLGLPPTLDDMARIIGIDLSNGRDDRTVRRAMTLDSKITGGTRIIERYATARGALWMAHDYGADGALILNFPLLPWASSSHSSGNDGRDEVPKLAGSRALFTLPNGWPAFMLFDEDGKSRLSQRLPIPAAVDEHHEPGPVDDQGQPKSDSNAPPPPARAGENPPPPPVVKPPLAAVRSAILPHASNGLSCARCHTMGPLTYEDHLAEHLAGNAYRGNPLERDIVHRIVFSKPELQNAIADDRYAVRRAQSATGIEAGLQVDGYDVMTGLAARYTRDLDLAAAAAELLLPAAQLQAVISRLSRTATPASILATRLALGRLTRAEFEALRPALLNAQDTTTRPAMPAPPPLAPPPATFRLWTDKISYNREDRIVLSVSADRPCYLTLININQAGKATVLFPNEFSRDNLLTAHDVMRLPAADALYFFKLQQVGTESFVAICEEGEPVPAGIRPDFTHMNFTDLDDWDEFLDRSVKAATEPRVPLKNGDDIDRRHRKKPPVRPAPSTSPAQFRAAVTVTIAP